MENFYKFCGGPLWNDTQFLSATWPQFTHCFMSVCLVWVPCGLLLLLTPAYVIWLRHHQVTLTLAFTRLNATKLLCQMSMVIASFVMLLRRTGNLIEADSMDKLTDGIKIISFLTIAMLGQYERKKGVTASMVQFTFWTGYSLGQTIPAYTVVKLKVYNHDPMTFVIFYLTFALSLTLAFLNCWSEHPGISAYRRGYMEIDERDPCPLESASVLSSLTFAWMFSILKTGYKRILDESEMWAVPQDMTADSMSGSFEDLWNQEIDNSSDGYSGACYGVQYSKDQTKSRSSSLSSSNSMTDCDVKRKSGFALDRNNMVYTERTRLTDGMGKPRSVYSDFLHNNSFVDMDDKSKPSGYKDPSLLRVLWRLCRTSFVHSTMYRLLGDALTVLGPLLLRLFIQYLGNRRAWSEWQGYGICILLFLVYQTRSVWYGQATFLSSTTAVSANIALSSAVYKKVLRLRKAINLDSTHMDKGHQMSSDGLQIQQCLLLLGTSITTPLMTLIVMVVVYVFVGPPAIMGLFVLFLLLPLNILLSIKQSDFLQQDLGHKHSRTSTLREVFKNIKVVKLFAWEDTFESKVQKIRSSEKSALLRLSYCLVVSGVLWNISTYMVSFATFITIFIGYPEGCSLDPGTGFMMLVYFSSLRKPLDDFKDLVYHSVQAVESCQRIREFLLQEEICEDAVTVTPGAEFQVQFEDASLSWGVNSDFKLKNLNLTIDQGSLVAVVGSEGCGKSSLLSAIVGEMVRTGGKVTRKGTVAYMPRDPWLQNGTIRENITFGKAYREPKVKAVVTACDLDADLAAMSLQEDTEIGEQGIELTVSQKQRTSLARAVYHDCELYLLDKPLCYVDGRVARQIFNSVLGPKGLLKYTTRVLVTDSIHILPLVDTIVVLDDGRISDSGSYDELTSYRGPFIQYLKNSLFQERFGTSDGENDPEIVAILDDMWDRVERLTSDISTPWTPGDEAPSERIRENPVLPSVKTHQRYLERSQCQVEKGTQSASDDSNNHRQVSREIVWKYLKSIGLVTMVTVVTMFMSYQVVDIVANAWLFRWNRDYLLDGGANVTHRLHEFQYEFYPLVYLLCGIGQLTALLCFNYLFFTGVMKANSRIHDALMSRLLKAPMKFYNATPLHDIVNRCSDDMCVMDTSVPLSSKRFISTSIQIISSLMVIIVTSPAMVVIIAPLFAAFLLLMKIYTSTVRQLSRIERASQHPIYSHFSDSMQGASTIRAFNNCQRFLKDMNKRMDGNNAFSFGVCMATRWMELNVDILSNIILFMTGILQIIAHTSDPGFASLAILYSLQISQLLHTLVYSLTDIVTDMESVEKIDEYTQLPQETHSVLNDSRPSATWPFPGNVEFQELCMGSESNALESPLKDICIRIVEGEKIGVVDFSGSSRRSILWSLFRLMEATRGDIYIDGVNIASIGLRDLRSKLSIMPKDRVLFNGTLRFNLDPMGEFDDEEIWTALSRSHIKSFVMYLSDQLEFDVGEGGVNLSPGHRELVCLARTLLRKTSVLVIEEPTVKVVDSTTDMVVNNTLRMAFQRCTVITLTDSIHTVIGCDRVLVLEDGFVKEFDTPKILLHNTTSTFFSMAVDAGIILGFK